MVLVYGLFFDPAYSSDKTKEVCQLIVMSDPDS